MSQIIWTRESRFCIYSIILAHSHYIGEVPWNVPEFLGQKACEGEFDHLMAFSSKCSTFDKVMLFPLNAHEKQVTGFKTEKKRNRNTSNFWAFQGKIKMVSQILVHMPLGNFKVPPILVRSPFGPFWSNFKFRTFSDHLTYTFLQVSFTNSQLGHLMSWFFIVRQYKKGCSDRIWTCENKRWSRVGISTFCPSGGFQQTLSSLMFYPHHVLSLFFFICSVERNLIFLLNKLMLCAKGGLSSISFKVKMTIQSWRDTGFPFRNL